LFLNITASALSGLLSRLLTPKVR